MTSSPLSSTLAAALPSSFRSASPFPQILRSAAASSSSSLSSLFQVNKDDGDIIFNVSDEARAHQLLISQGFGPTIAVVASRECDDMLKGKGCSGLLEILKPFGDQVQGRVNIRDSQAMSVPVDDFSVNFVDFLHYTKTTANGQTTPSEGRYAPKQTTRTYVPGGDLDAIEQLLEKKIESIPQTKEVNDDLPHDNEYAFFLRRILSAMPVSAHETFSHPVACILAVSSRHPEPIDAFLGLYNTTNNATIPRFIDAGFLRYYVLVHDEDNDDFDRSLATLEKMKRSLGLHCSILRINTIVTEKDIPLGKSTWISAGEEVAYLTHRGEPPQISLSDQESLQRFVRVLITQSVVPHMERCISMWNDQIASYRRGIAGRVFTASRRLFSTSSRSATPTSGTGNYDTSTSSYPPSTPEAQMRKLADYAFMLRDYKLAHSTYDIVRKDFANDKAWKYAAGAQVFRKRKRVTEYQEMTAISLLFLPTPLTMTKRTEVLDPLIDSAFYSYTARLSSPYHALRMVLMAVELLCLKGGTAPDDAVKWITRALGTGNVGDFGTCLLLERIATCYKIMHPRRKRKMALWSMIACENWIGVGCKGFAMRCLMDAARVYKECPGFLRIEKHMNGLMESLGVQREAGEKEEVVDMQHEDVSEGITVEFA